MFAIHCISPDNHGKVVAARITPPKCIIVIYIGRVVHRP
jgi:hypothetical protein